jgi:hypothetical protein
VALTADPEDAALAQTLGWSGGLPGFDVTIVPTDSSAGARTARTSSSGVADFGTIPPGSYFLDTQRWLTAGEAGTLPAALGIDGWATRQRITAASGGGTLGVTVPTSRRRSLVISEWSFNPDWSLALGDYLLGGFLELYNNSDSTMYLDGLIIGEGFSLTNDYPNFPCSGDNLVALDPAGLWARWWQAFPGRGHDYPLLAGRTTIIATDAIDHRPIYPGTLDLSHADFEFVASDDVDNPAVPNMVDAGVQAMVYHGILFEDLSAVPFLALPVDTAAIPRQFAPGATKPWGRIPADRLLDVVMIVSNYAASPYPECAQLILPKFDRAPSRVRGTVTSVETRYSVQRRVGFTLPGGRKVLQHTRSGFADFVRAIRSPGSLP